MKNRFRLQHLEVSAFRGARDKLSVPLNKPLNIIYGPNGAGKSTLTTAIEWALFPKDAVRQTSHEIDERRGWEIAHVHGATKPLVMLELRNDVDEKILIRQSGTQPTKIQCTYNTFKNLAFVHQEIVRDFLVGTPAPRQSAFQRLLGAGWVQDLASAIGKSAKELHCKEADEKVKELRSFHDFALRSERRRLVEAEGAAAASGFKAPWDQAVKSHARKIDQHITQLCKDAAISEPDCVEAEPLQTYCLRLSKVLVQLRSAGPGSRHSDLASQKTRLQAAQSHYEATSKIERELAGSHREAIERAGDMAHIAARMETLVSRGTELKQELSALNYQRVLIIDAIAYFRKTPGVKTCPVCGNSVAGTLADDLSQHLNSASSELEQKLQIEIADIEKSRVTVERDSQELSNLQNRLTEAAQILHRAQRELEKAVGRTFRADEDPVGIAAAEMNRLDIQLSAIQKAAELHFERIQTIEDEAKKINHIKEVQSAEERVTKLAVMLQTPLWGRMEEAHTSISQREQNLKLANAAVVALASGCAQRNLDRARAPINEIYSRLTLRKDFPAINIDPEKKFEIGVANDEIVHAATAVLNLTDLNALALAIISGMATTFPEVHDLEFLILDDPSQGMDEEVTCRLGEVISDLAGKIQIVIATPDPDLLEVLQRSEQQKNVIRLKPRDTEATTPSIQMEPNN